MTKVWLEAGFRSEQVDIKSRRLVFRRVALPKGGETAASGAKEVDRQASARRHPLFGALKGLLRIMPGTDLTRPADPKWGGA